MRKVSQIAPWCMTVKWSCLQTSLSFFWRVTFFFDSGRCCELDRLLGWLTQRAPPERNKTLPPYRLAGLYHSLTGLLFPRTELLASTWQFHNHGFHACLCYPTGHKHVNDSFHVESDACRCAMCRYISHILQVCMCLYQDTWDMVCDMWHVW